MYMHFLCLKSLSLYHSLNGVSEATSYLSHLSLDSLESFASYTVFRVKHLLSKGHSFLIVKLPPKYSLLGFKTFLLCDNITDPIFLMQQ